ncbi:MAG: tetratricopeptide repeat protein, partial [Candidatus Aminicenantes bacterium]|nr:tetratricopeptide repeat protein [Candidatus Aminicenantes bacterium]
SEKNIEPVLSLGGEFLSRVTGFDLNLSLVYRGRETVSTFSARGTNDLISRTIDEVNAFIARKTGGLAGAISGSRTFAQICTGNADALVHFLKGDQAWAKLDSEAAYAEFKTAVEIDPAFSLVRLKLAEVQIFRGDRAEARAELRAADQNKASLISYDLLRLNALLARLDSKPSEEREYLRRLVEAFPLNREYQYEFAESYFHAGDGAEAAKGYIKALEIDPAYALAHNHLAFCYSWNGDHAQAEKHFRRYVELDNTANSYDSLASGYMFAGRYGQAVEACERGLALDHKLYYLFSTKATNLMLQGRLSLAEDALAQEVKSDARESTRLGARFNSAFIEYLRGNLRNADNALISLRDAYSAPSYGDQLDDTSNLPFWLAGVIAARQKNAARLRDMIAVLDKKIADKGVNVTNYSPILKFDVHLKALQAALDRKPEDASRFIEEGERLKYKMGYWSSPYNLAFFLDEFAVTLMNLGQTAKARDLFNQVLVYNPNCAAAHTHLAVLLELNKDLPAARAEAGTARSLLAGADPDYGLLQELEALERRLK